LEKAVERAAPEWSLRPGPAGEGDEEFLFRLFAAAKADEFQTGGWAPGAAESLFRMQFTAQQRVYRELFASGENRIVMCGGKPVGHIWISRTPEEIRVVDMALLPEVRGFGIGSALVQSLVGEASVTGRVVRSQVRIGNEPSLRMGLSQGFKVVGQDATHLQLEWRAEPGS
jgi:GNAT superfamily N-acetyltransferase